MKPGDPRSRTEPPSELEVEELETMRAKNVEAMNKLLTRGVDVNLTGALLDHLIDEMIPLGTWWRHDFSVRWEQKAAELVADIDDKVRKAILMGKR